MFENLVSLIKRNWHAILPVVLLLISFLGRWKPNLFPPYVLDLSFFVFSFALLISAIAVIVLPVSIIILIFKREFPARDSWKTINFLGISLVAFLTFWYGSEFIPRGLPNGSYALSFDSKIWIAPESNKHGLEISPREKMLGDLVENILPGKTKKEIEDILGPSLETEYFNSVDKDMIYYLGRQRDSGINIDSEWLLIWLDKDGVFSKIEIYND